MTKSERQGQGARTAEGTARNPPEPRLERLQKIIASAGLTSRRRAEEWIRRGRVQINGHTVTELGSRADPFRDVITVDGKPLRPGPPRRYILLYKPPRFLSSLDDPKGRPLVTDLLRGVRERVYPVGRLDFMSEGLLLLTNDGEFANALAHPSHGVTRTYRVKVRGVPDEGALDRVRAGKVRLDGRPVRPVAFHRVGGKGNPWFEVTLREGRNRELRRLFEAIGHPVVKLRRTEIGPLRPGTLGPGEWRDLTLDEVNALWREAGRAPGGRRVPPRGRRRSGGPRGRSAGRGTGRSDKGRAKRRKKADGKGSGGEVDA